MRTLLFFILSIISLSIALSAQSDTLTIVEKAKQPSTLSSLFDKRLNTHTLNSSLFYSRKFGDYSFFLSEDFRSTVVKSNTTSIKDENYFAFSNAYKLYNFLDLGFLVNSNTYSDDRRLTINKTTSLQGKIFLNLRPVEKILVTPFAGYSENQQVAVSDVGPLYGSELVLDNYTVDDFILSGNAKFENEDISPRKNTYRFINLNLNSNFEEFLRNDLRFSFTEQRRDFYFASDSLTSAAFNINNNIQSRTENQYQLQSRLLYFPPASNFSMNLNGRVYWRNIDRDTRYILSSNVTQSSFDTRIEEFKIDLSSSGTYRLENFRTSLRISYSEKEERHTPKPIPGANEIFFNERKTIERQKNNSANVITLASESLFNMSERDRFSFSLFHRKLIYNTPSEENFDDRDELLTTAKLSYIRKLNHFFDLFVNIEGSLNKIVYIFAERSSNNNIKRFLKLESGGIYKSRNVISSNRAEVSANYTVYDYEELNPNFKSFSFRQFAFRDSTIILWNNNLKSEILGYVKLSEQGDFKWNDFANQPVRFLEEIYAEPKTFYRINELELGLGLRFFRLSTFNYDDNGSRVLATRYSSIGPLVDIRVLMNERLRFNLYGYYEFISDESNNQNEQTNLNLRVDWIL